MSFVATFLSYGFISIGWPSSSSTTLVSGKTVKEEGKENNLVDLIAADPAFGLTKADIEKNLKPELYVGRAPRQVDVYLRDVVNPVLEAHKDESGVKAEINV